MERAHHVTRNLLIRVVAWCSHHAAEAERRSDDQQEAADRVRAWQQHAAKLLTDLDPADADRAARVRRWCRQILDEGEGPYDAP
ncbi:hypothetical protein [Nonomuraea sp. NPDC050310]|uniref:hypothetical protein n=1 Tax=Nonomuraea sp. NPDC050310 TaxID=3154935 RepID=UPI0033F76C37